jgi:DNA-binding beta-propeller fold protein YncE
MSLKQIEVAIASSVIVQTLAALPNGAWFFLNNGRLQGRASEKPADSHLNGEKMPIGFRPIGKDVDNDGNLVDVVCFAESPNQAFRVDPETGKRIRGTNYLSIVFRGNLGKDARERAMAWDTVGVFGRISTTTDKDGKSSTVLTAMYLTDGTETVSAQLLADVSQTFTVSEDVTQATA